MRTFWSVLLVLTLVACGEPSTEPDSSFAGWDGGFEIPPPVAPELPTLTPCLEGWLETPSADDEGVTQCEPWPEGDPVTLPIMTPCAEGWREVTLESDDAVVTCEPWPDGGVAECPRGEAQLPGAEGCQPLGIACPSGDWAEDLPLDQEVLYVLVGASADGDGSRDAPFATIAEATRAARSGTVIALSKGTFDERVTLRPRITLWGACASETILGISGVSDTDASITVRGQGAVVRNLAIDGRRPGVTVFGLSLSVHLENVAIASARSYGLGVGSEASATGRNVVVSNTEGRSDGQLGRGLQIETGASVELERIIIEGNREAGAYVTGEATTLILNDAVVRDTQLGLSPTSGCAVLAHSGADIEINRSVMERNLWRALYLDNAGTTLTMTDSVVRDTASEDDGWPGIGLFLEGGAEAELHRTTFARNRKVGVYVTGSGSSLSLTDVAVIDTQRVVVGDAAREMGRGLWVDGEAHADISRAVFTQNQEFGLFVGAPGTVANLSDVVVSDTESRELDGEMGSGLGVDLSALVVLDRGLFERNRLAGIYASLAGTSLVASNIVVRDSRNRVGDILGCGVLTLNGASVQVDGGLFERNQGAGLLAFAATLDARDVVVRDTQFSTSGLFGRGVSAEQGARVSIERGLIERNLDIGAFVGVEGATLTLTDVVVRDTDVNIEGQYGRGIEVTEGGHCEVTRALVERNREHGIGAVGEGTSLVLIDTVVRDTAANEYGEYGRGLLAQEGAQVDVERGVFEGNREIAVYACSPETDVRLSDVVVTETDVRECAATSCPDYPLGIGVGVYGGAHVEMVRFSVTENVLCGVQLAHGARYDHERFEDGGSLDLRDGEISHNQIGVNVQSEGFDIDRLLDDVICRDNERNLDTDELPVPEAMEFL